MALEQRRNQRYQINTGAFAAFGREYSNVGKIKDISLGGLSFISIKSLPEAVMGASVIAIYQADNGFYLSNLPCKVVYGMPFAEYKRIKSSPEGISFTKYGIKFGGLAESKREALAFFLENHTIKGGP